MGGIRTRIGVVAISLCLTATFFDGSAVSGAPVRVLPAPGTVCTNSNQATLSAVFDTVLDTAAPILPAEYSKVLPGIRAEGHRRLQATHIATTAVSMPRSALTGSQRSGLFTVDDPVANYIVTQLMNARDGKISQTIRADKLTLNQAIETAYFLIYTTTLVPLRVISSMIPSIASLGPISVGTLIRLPLELGVYGFTAIYRSTQKVLENQCVAQVRPGDLAGAGQPTPGTDSGVRVPAIVTELSNTLEVSDGTCEAVADLDLGTVIDRTHRYLHDTAPTAAGRAQIDDQWNRLRWSADRIMVPDNLIPENSDDFSTIESLLSTALSLVPQVGGAATDVLIGLGDNASHGRKFDHTVPLSKLSVDKSLTAARYAYALTTQVFSIGYGLGTDAISAIFTGGSGLDPFSLIPSPFPIIDAPNNYGLATYHHVLRDVCLRGRP